MSAQEEVNPSGTAVHETKAPQPTLKAWTHFEVAHRLSGVGRPADEASSVEPVDYDNLTYPTSTNDYSALPTYPTRPHFDQHHIGMERSTQVVAFDGCPNDPYHPAAMPIYQTATFVQPSAEHFGPYDYTRSGNPTRTALETLVAGLENAYEAFAFTSGMAALGAVTRLAQSGQEILAGADLYGGMHRLLTQVCQRHGIVITFVDTTNLDAVRAAIKPHTRLLHIETPSNPLMRISDIRALATLLHERNVLFSIDSTMMTPILQRPLDLGADVVVHSATKFLAGHSDTSVGLVCVASPALAKDIAFFQNAEGTGLAPFDCWLTLRGIKTLALRVERATQSAQIVAEFLSKHPSIRDVHYPNLKPEPPQPWHVRDRDLATSTREYELQQQQSSGGGSLLSFTTGSLLFSRRFVDGLRLFKITVSFGSCNSLVELPGLLSHASIPKHLRTFPEDLVRVSIGIESIKDILEDLTRALAQAAAGSPEPKRAKPNHDRQK